MPIHKGGDKEEPLNYRSVSLTSRVANICEKINDRWLTFLEDKHSHPFVSKIIAVVEGLGDDRLRCDAAIPQTSVFSPTNFGLAFLFFKLYFPLFHQSLLNLSLSPSFLKCESRVERMKG